MTAFSASISAALDAANETYSKARPETGGPQRPPKGDWAMILNDLEIDSEDYTFRNGDKDIPAFAVRSTYTVFGEPEPVPPDMKKGQQWFGKSFILPTAPINSLDGANQGKNGGHKGAAWRADDESGRLRGLLQVILGDKASGNLKADLSAAITLIKSSVVVLRVRCLYEESQKKAGEFYFKDVALRRLSA